MAISVTIVLKNQMEIERAFREFPEKSAREFDKAVRRSARKLAEGVRGSRLTPADTGKMKNTIREHRIGKMAFAVRSGVNYALFVHEGTKPHFPPPSALKRWAIAHGMPGAEFAIARKIAQRGTKRRPFFEWALRGGLQRAIDRLMVEALKRIKP